LGCTVAGTSYALDFEEMNKTLFYGQYRRCDSYFTGTELASSGLPTGKELEILESVRDKIPAEVFTKPFQNPVTDSEGARRANLREAIRLLREAGYEVRDGKLVNAKTGEPFRVDFLLVSPAFERIVLFYKPALERLGIEVASRVVDSSQYINRTRARDFDVIVAGWGQSLSPGNEQRDFFGSEAADREGSRNYGGIRDAGVDALINRVIFTKDRDDLVAATKALDRVLLWNHYVVPGWTVNYARTARWDRFTRPSTLPAYSFGFPDIWWYDKERAAKVWVKQ
jgi:microcin C transport system substrate-binding protein